MQNETTSTDPGAIATAVYAPLEHTPILPGTVTGTVYDGGVAIQTYTVSAGGSFTFNNLVSGLTTYAQSGTLNLNTGEMTVTWNTAPGPNNLVTSYEYNMACNQDLPEINLVVESEEIAAKTRKLRAVWSYEAQQDLRSQHNLDAEAALTAVLAQEISLEIDREVLTDLRNNAGTIAAWDFNTALGETIKEKYESLYIKIPLRQETSA